MKIESYDEWKKLAEIHNRFEKHSWVEASANNRRARICTVCGYTESAVRWWTPLGSSNDPHYVVPPVFNWAAKCENLVHALRYALENPTPESKSDEHSTVDPELIAKAEDVQGLKSMRPLIVESSPQAALAYARRFNDYAQDVYQSVARNGSLVIEWLKDKPEMKSDQTRKDACARGDWALQYAEFIDKGPHKRTLSAATRCGAPAFEYARLFKGQVKRSDMRRLAKGASRDSQSAIRWAQAFGVDKLMRELVCKNTKWTAYTYAVSNDEKNGKSKCYRDAIYKSFYYSYNYNMRVQKKPVLSWEKAAVISPYQSCLYQLAHGKYRKHINNRFSDYCGSKWIEINQVIKHVHASKMTYEQAMKKSITALVYLFLHKDLDALQKASLEQRLKKCWTYTWMFNEVTRDRESLNV
jgi:hypothetical protein